MILTLAGCQPNSTQEEGSAEKASTGRRATTRTEEKRQEAVLQKDTLNAVQEEVVRKPAPSSQEEFTAFFDRFERTIQQQDAEAFNQMIDPKQGLYIIESPGAVPQFTHLANISTFKKSGSEQGAFFTIRQKFNQCSLKEVKKLPAVTCEGENNNFEQQGCFLSDGTAFQKNEAYKYAGLPKEEQTKVAQTQLLVQKTVLHTSSGYKFHFGQVEGKWRVLFIDLMVPCSA
ncbi:hypothetical protein [Sabulibacter ruber]|uniref:hypothetical protein n=1 Tax=Sabulibacter ruber TaxID=2811901 RepID=UPI001A961F15|nr:hypothetical protein [Sabulibacter ruber]